jgi:hypothetical protein
MSRGEVLISKDQIGAARALGIEDIRPEPKGAVGVHPDNRHGEGLNVDFSGRRLRDPQPALIRW